MAVAPIVGQDAQWRQKNEQKDRYEGLLDQPNARRAYDVLGFFAHHAFSDRTPIGPKSILHVWYWVPEDLHAGEIVFVQCKQMSGRTNYLMEVKPEQTPREPRQWNHFSWPAETVVAPNRIDAARLGVVVRLRSNNEYAEELAPVVFYGQEKPPIVIDRYELVIRIQGSLESLSYRLANGHHSTTCYYTPSTPCGSQPPAAAGRIQAGTVVHLPLSLPTDSPAGPVSIHIEGQYQNSDEKLVTAYRFHHEPKWQ